MKEVAADFSVGDVVNSKAGRDKGSFFVVAWTNGDFVGLCDGESHKVDKIKRKKIRHITSTSGFSEYLRNKFAAGEKVTNSEVKRALDEFKSKQDAG
jgi:ribosomal protein L14E/L6E/L27E